VRGQNHVQLTYKTTLQASIIDTQFHTIWYECRALAARRKWRDHYSNIVHCDVVSRT